MKEEQFYLDPEQEAAVNNHIASLQANARTRLRMERRGELYLGGWCESARRLASIAREVVQAPKLTSVTQPSAGLMYRVQLSFYDKKTGTMLRRFVVPARSIIKKNAQGEAVITYPTGEMLFIRVTSRAIKLLRIAGFPTAERAALKRLGYGPSGRWGLSFTD